MGKCDGCDSVCDRDLLTSAVPGGWEGPFLCPSCCRQDRESDGDDALDLVDFLIDTFGDD
jgi:hypothetical protein